MDSITEEANINHVLNEKIPLLIKLAYGVGHVLNDVCASMWFTYLLVYFHLVLQFDSTSAGLVLLIGQVADALATPFVGYYSDRDDNLWLCQYGKRKTWHLFGTICVIGTFPFIFSECISCETSTLLARLFYYAAFIVIFQFGWAAVQISHLSLIPDLTASDNERTSLTAIRYSFTVFSNVLILLVTLAVLHLTSIDPHTKLGPEDSQKFQKVALIGMSVGIISTIIFHVFVKETRVQSSSSTAQEPSQRQLRPPFSLFKDLELYQVASIYMPTRLFVNLTQSYIPLYIHYNLNMPKTALALIPLVMYLSSFKASLTIHYLNAKLGRMLSYLIGAVMGLSACVWIWFGKGPDFVNLYIYPTSLLLGSGGSMMLVTSLAITADYIGSSTENGAFVYGVMSFADKLSNGIAVMIIQYTTDTTNCSDYKKVLTFVCGGAALVGLVMTICRTLCKRYLSGATNYSNLNAQETRESRETSSNS